MATTATITLPDIIVIILYFIAIIAVGIWSTIRSSRDSMSGYFLASRNMHWIPVGASLFASNIGSGHFIGLAGSGAASGIAVAGFELGAVFSLLLLGYIFSPVYMAAGVYTMPEYMRKRFGGQRIRIYLSVLALILYIFTKISVDLFGGALFIHQAIGWDLYSSIVILLIVAAIFTIAGGLTAVIWTDFAQIVLMVFGSFILMGLTFAKMGGYHRLIDEYMNAEANHTIYDSNGLSCGKSPDDAMHLLRDPTPGKSELPWTGMVFGLSILAIWYWCSDQVIVQRILASKSMIHGKAGSIFASYFKLLPLFLLVIPGMAAKALYPDEVGCVLPEECKIVCGSERGCSNIAYPILVIRLMPQGLTGLMLAVMIAALMSSLTSIFNSSSTIFAVDIWTQIRKNASEYEKLIVGRLFVVVMVIISIIWIPVIQASRGSQLFNYIQSMQSFFSPPITAVYLLGIFVPRCNEKGAFWGLMAGLIIGFIRLVLEYSSPLPPCGQDVERSVYLKSLVDDIHYMHFAIILFAICIIVSMMVSVLTPPIQQKHLYRLTFWSRHSKEVRIDLEESHKEEKPILPNKPAIKSVEPSILRRIVNFLCGFDTQKSGPAESQEADQLTDEEQAKRAAEFLYEPKKQKLIVNINAVVCLCCVCFLWAFYA